MKGRVAVAAGGANPARGGKVGTVVVEPQDAAMLTIEPTGAVLGATARGVDLARPLSERSLGQILLALGRYGVLRFSASITSPRPRRDILGLRDGREGRA